MKTPHPIVNVGTGQQYRVIYSGYWRLFSPDIEVKMNAMKLPHISKTGTVHVKYSGGLLCGSQTKTQLHNEPVTANDLCGRCLRVLCCIWEPQATPPVTEPPF